MNQSKQGDFQICISVPFYVNKVNVSHRHKYPVIYNVKRNIFSLQKKKQVRNKACRSRLSSMGRLCIGHDSFHFQGLIEKNNLGVGNVNRLTTRHVLGYCTLYRLLTFRRKLYANLTFCFDHNINYYNTLKAKKELFVFVLLSLFHYFN